MITGTNFRLYWKKPDGTQRMIDVFDFYNQTFRVQNLKTKKWKTYYVKNEKGSIIMRSNYEIKYAKI